MRLFISLIIVGVILKLFVLAVQTPFYKIEALLTLVR